MKNPICFFNIITLVVITSFMTAGCENIDPNTNATVTSVTLSPATANVAKGGTQQFNATVTGTNNPAKTVTWSIEQTNKNAGTTINASGKLTVASGENLTSLTIKAVSTADTKKSGTATVTILAPADSTKSLTSVSGAFEILGSYDNRQDVMKIDVSKLNTNWAVAEYSLAAYKDKKITITLSVDVKREGTAGTLNWQINNASDNYPSVASVNAAVGTWHTMSGTWEGTPTNASPSLYLNNDKTANTTYYYIDNLVLTIEEGFIGFTGEALNGSSNEQVTRKFNGYDYELWNQNKQGTANMTIGNGGGGTYKCNWSGIENVLFRAGRKYDSTQTHSQIGTFSIEYNASYSPVGNSYLSVYGWTKNPLVEYYIIDNYGTYNPINGSGVVNKGTATIDGAVYDIFTAPRVNQPSIDGTKTFTQYFSVRKIKRSSGTISVTEHFNAWNTAGMTDIATGKLYEVALKVEGYQSSGSAEITKNILSVNGTPIK